MEEKHSTQWGQEKQHNSTGHAGRRTATEQPCNGTGGKPLHHCRGLVKRTGGTERAKTFDIL